jgi:hypothetical protein
MYTNKQHKLQVHIVMLLLAASKAVAEHSKIASLGLGAKLLCFSCVILICCRGGG